MLYKTIVWDAEFARCDASVTVQRGAELRAGLAFEEDSRGIFALSAQVMRLQGVPDLPNGVARLQRR